MRIFNNLNIVRVQETQQKKLPGRTFEILCRLNILLLFLSFPCQASTWYEAALKRRSDSMIDYYKKLPYGVNSFSAAAKLRAGYDKITALQIVDSVLAHPNSEMFWFYQVMAMYCISGDSMPTDYKLKIRRAVKGTRIIRGDTENHWMMYYTAMYLAAQSWPEAEDRQAWFNGKSAEENRREAEGWLYNWMEMTASIGQGEFISPQYGIFYITPLSMLFDYAREPMMHKKSQIMMHWMLADYFENYFDGLYAGAYSRIYDYDIFSKRHTQMSQVAALLIGDKPLFNEKGERTAWSPNLLILAFSQYKLPDLIYSIATDRSKAYEIRERKRSRERIRFASEICPSVSRYTYMDSGFCMGSLPVSCTEPFLQHSWHLSWKAQQPEELSTFFTLQPYYSGKDISSLINVPVLAAVEDVMNTKKDYGSEDKWLGASPAEQIFQYKNTVLGLYDLRLPDVAYKHYDAYFSKDLKEMKRDLSGWIFCRATHIWFAFYPLRSYTLKEETKGQRLRSTDLQNGFILYACAPGKYTSFDAFQSAVKSSRVSFSARKMSLSYKNPEGQEMSFRFNSERSLDGKIQHPEDYQFFDSPFLQSETGSQKLEIKYKSMRMYLDLKEGRVTEAAE